jgi:cytidine deaminase
VKPSLCVRYTGCKALGTWAEWDRCGRGEPDGRGAVIDWEGLRTRAREMTARAYAPYSNFQVGAAALVEDGRVVVGCNVENAAYGVALCAECGLVSALHASGGGRLVAFACVDKRGATLMPCGRCRQLLWENGGPDLLVDTPRGILPMTDVLPQAFGADQLAEVTARPPR